MTMTFSFTRRFGLMAAAIVVCGVSGAMGGWYSAMQLRPVAGEHQQEVVFVVPPGPSNLIEVENTPIDPGTLRVWEQTARQPLPPRKEPLTPPNWKIVGVTAVGNEKSVLLLFEKKMVAEPRKVGDLLPGGARIVQISQDELRVALKGQLMKLVLHKQ